ncbi:MAG: 2-oxo acid dehydrogenase subunit E2 [Rhizobiales bacterium]|nr:2-oxo acid dehydrogenase subunit E2 [Hyphomicrobiales bacterium]NRB13212.1 2-oxo acid dehydrogenase subunit E2 [Hyphomicrobiales bacterium]
MAVFDFLLPDLGEGVVTSEIVELHVKVGQVVEEDDVLIAMMTDKATVELPSPVDGKIIKIAGAVGDIINVGEALISFEVSDQPNIASSSVSASSHEVVPPAPTSMPKDVNISKASSAKPMPAEAINGDILASPSLRRRAADEDIDLGLIVGSGPAGRLTHADLDGFIASGGTYISQVVHQLPSSGEHVPGKVIKTAIAEIPMRGVRRKIAEAMEISKLRIPHYTYVEEVDLTDLEKLRGQLNAERSEAQPKLTLLPFLMQAIVKAVAKYPQVNAHYDAKNQLIKQFEPVHFGMAANTPNGLMVPVIKHAEAMDIWGYADKIVELADKARTLTATRDELTGSTITITSLGKMGGIVTTPIINAPEVCIIGNNKLVERPMVFNGEIVIRKMMNISASFDHRIVDGYDGAQFVQYIKSLLEVPATLFMGDV